MKVLFANPPWWAERYLATPQDGSEPRIVWRAGLRAGSRWPHTNLIRSAPNRFVPGDYIPYPFFLGFAATYAQRHADADVTFRDSIALRESYESFFRHLAEQRYDYLVIETATPSWEHDLALMRKIRELLPDCRLVIAGPIVNSPSLKQADGLYHAAIRGEYEKGVVRVLNGATGIIDYDLLTVEEMNAAPFPYMDALYAPRYWDDNPKGQIWPQMQLWGSRGCPYKCIFCVWPATMTGNDPDGSGKRSVRHYSGRYVEAWIRHYQTIHPFRSIYFDDDTFNLGGRHVLDICDTMERVGLPWSAMCRADTIPIEVWPRMRETGCFGVKIGFESGNQHVVDTIVNKRLDLARARDVVVYLKSLGMSVHGTFTYGLPGETKEQMADTLRYRQSLPLDTYQESGTAEIEGTPLALLREKGSLARYSGAAMADDYHVESDGARKLGRIARSIGP